MIYNIWVEGWSATGGQGTAQRICTCEGETFQEACDNAYKRGFFKGWGHYSGTSLWGCKLFDNYEDAARSFG